MYNKLLMLFGIDLSIERLFQTLDSRLYKIVIPEAGETKKASLLITLAFAWKPIPDCVAGRNTRQSRVNLLSRGSRLEFEEAEAVGS